MTTSPDFLKNTEDYFNHAASKYTQAKSKNALLVTRKDLLHDIRMCLEAMVNKLIETKSPANAAKILKEELFHKIDYLQQKQTLFFKNDREKESQLPLMHQLRWGGNKGSHIMLDLNKEPSKEDCEYCFVTLKTVVKWFYASCGWTLPPVIADYLEKEEIDENRIALSQDWFELASQYQDFKNKSSKYILITSPDYWEELSPLDMDHFVQADINWNLIIDTDPTSLDNSLWNKYKQEVTIENLRVYTPSMQETKIDIVRNVLSHRTYWYAAFDKIPSDTTLKQWSIGDGGKKLRAILSKFYRTDIHASVTILVMSSDDHFVKDVLNEFTRIYETNCNQITVAILYRNASRLEKLKEYFDEFSSVFAGISYHFITNKALFEGFGYQRRVKAASDVSVIHIPAYTVDQKDMELELPASFYDEYKTSKFIEVVHCEIGKDADYRKPEAMQQFYIGNEITWADLAVSGGRGIDIYRTQQRFIADDLLALLGQINRSTCLSLYYEPSSGGTTLAKRIAYDIGTRHYPTLVVHKYHYEETLRAIENVYEKVNGKSILVITEDGKVSANEIDLLLRDINKRNKHIVILYLKRAFGKQKEKALSVRSLNTELDREEIERFEEELSGIVPDRRTQILAIKKYVAQDQQEATPFIYGLTAFDSSFVKLEKYVGDILAALPVEIEKMLSYICFIGKYTNKTIPLNFFDRLRGSNRMFDYYDPVWKLVKSSYTEENVLEARHYLLANETLIQILCQGDLTRKPIWKSFLKVFIFELIDFFRDLNPDGLIEDSKDKELLEALFVEKKIASYPDENCKFSALITEINQSPDEGGIEFSHDIFEKLTKTFPEHPFFHQHFSRLYLQMARDKGRIRFFESAVTEAQRAIDLDEGKSSSVFHTKGDAIVRQLEFYKTHWANFKEEPAIEEKIKALYEEAEEALYRSIELDPDSNYGYTSFVYLVVYILDLGRIISNVKTLNELFEKEQFDWYTEKVQLGMEMLDVLFNLTDEKDQVILVSLRRNFDKIDQFIHAHNVQYYEEKERGTRSANLKMFYRSAMAKNVLDKVKHDYSPMEWNQIDLPTLRKVIDKLKLNLQTRPTSLDLRLYLKAVRCHKSTINMADCAYFLEMIHAIADNRKDGLIVSETSYYLYIIYSILSFNDVSLDSTYQLKAERYLKKSESLGEKNQMRRDTFDYEWLGKNIDGTLRQIINRTQLGEFNLNEFTQNISLLQEVEGRIKSVGSYTDQGSRRKNGIIEFNLNNSEDCFHAYFVPVKGGVDVEGNFYRFDDPKYVNTQRVKFFLAFSLSGYRAWQPIPADKERANTATLKKLQKGNTVEQPLTEGGELKVRVETIDNRLRKMACSQKGSREKIFIDFEEGKEYAHYKSLRRSEITVVFQDGKYKIVQV